MVLLSYAIVEFYLLYDGAVDMQIRSLLTRSQCRVADTQVTVKACGPLVIFIYWKLCARHISWVWHNFYINALGFSYSCH